jgi:glycosyltransferase involved in cell wall biosynthesis
MVVDFALNEARPLMSDSPPVRRPQLLHVLPSFAVGGVQVRLARVINALGLRYRHRIFALDGNTACRSLIDEGLEVTAETAPPPQPLKALPSALRIIRRDLRAARPDLLLTYNWGSIEWAIANRLFRIAPHIHFEDGFGPEETEQRLLRRSLMRRWALARSEQIIVPSRTLATIARTEWHLDPKRVRYIANGIDASGFVATSKLEPPLFARDASEVIIGTVAPLRPEKNVGRLVRVFAQLRTNTPTRLAIAGGGAQRDEIEAMARQLGVADRVIFLGSVAQPQRALALFDIFALSSNTEQMPMSVLEAMAMGLPVVSVDVGDVKRMLADENSDLIVPKEREDSFAGALAELVVDPARRASLGALNRQKVQTVYAWKAMVEEYERVFSTR